MGKGVTYGCKPWKRLIALSALTLCAAMGTNGWARERANDDLATDNLTSVALTTLPRQAIETYQLIHQGSFSSSNFI